MTRVVRPHCKASTRVLGSVLVALAFLASPALAQESARVGELNERLSQILAQLPGATSEQAVGLRNQAAGVIAQCAEALSALIAQNPREALTLAFSQQVLAQLGSSFPESAALLESRGIWQGELEYLIEDDESMTTSRSHLRLRVAQQVLQLHLAGPEPPGLKSGDQLQVQGVRAGNLVAVETASLVAASEAAVCSTLGEQPVITILVNLQSFTLAPAISTDLVKGILLGNAFAPTSQSVPDWSVDNFWRENSDGKTWVNSALPAVVGPYTLSGDFNSGGNCDSDGMRTAAINAADPSVNFQNYSRVMIVFPPNNACTFAGLGTLGCTTNNSPGDGNFTASVAWNRSDQMPTRSSGVQLLTHEGGHNLTLHHASSRDFGAETLGPVGAAGTLVEYGDWFSTMGAWNFGLYSAQHAVEQLNWLTLNTNYQVVESSGVYAIQNYERRPAALKALKIRRGTGNDAWLWVEYRQNTGIYDSQLSSQVWTGVLIHYKDSLLELIRTCSTTISRRSMTGTLSRCLPVPPGPIPTPTFPSL
ncbi:MAG: hypothetical protein HY316_03075 [Acidobacteria bacterium]|nr:hypothetical protein [Acidobacteriota bacterium]